MNSALAFDAKRAFHNHTGLGNYSRFILSGLAERYADRYSFHLMNPKPGSLFSERDPVLKEERPEGIYSTFSSLWRSAGMYKDLRKMDVRLFHGLSNELPAGLSLQNIRSIVSIHDLIFESHPQFYRAADRWIYQKKFRSAAQNADRVLSVSAHTREELIERYAIPEEKIFVHYQSCHTVFQKDGDPKQDRQVQKDLKLPDQYALSVGTVEPRKNLLSSLKALKELDIPLVVIGKGGAYRKQCMDFVTENGMGHRLFWLSDIGTEQLASLYRCAALSLYPSEVEGFGIPIIEALFSRCPVITNRNGVFPEAGGPDSWYVNPQEPEEIRTAIRSILDDAQNTASRTERGLAYARKQFEPHQLIDQLSGHYQELLSN